ncbi:MAG TPA: galactokinase [Chitinophagaceae bacterium]
MKDQLLKEFRNRFHKDPEHIFFCPGRVNLIGEHIDYNGGKVMPCAISLGTYLAVSKNTDKLLRFQCLNFPETAELKLQSSYTKTGKEWFNYPLGVINEIEDLGHTISGMDMLFAGNLPIGSGLSSSASIEVLMAFTLNEIFGLGISKKDIAILSRKVENQFIGVNCGIMDQFAVAMGQHQHAILLNCDTIEYEYLPLQLEDYSLAIINTNKPRKLAESKYNERFIECGKALQALKTGLSVQNLCEVAPDEFLINRQLINDPVLEKRALHVITENDRVKQAEKLLKANDLVGFGKLMYASHQSLEELYEVSGKELDTIVEFCKLYDGCVGARMTGAGFGGCAIALVKKEKFDDFAQKLSAFYNGRIGYEPGVFASEVGDGVREIKS